MPRTSLFPPLLLYYPMNPTPDTPIPHSALRTPHSKIDLHTHTTASDGALTPTALLHRAAQVGISTLAITDHDTVAALTEARPVAEALGIRLITGVEFGTNWADAEIHMLGYFFDPDHPQMQRTLADLREGRLERGRHMVEKLNALGLSDVTWERVEQIAAGGSVGRPHVAEALIERGYASTIDEAFSKYLGRGKPAYVERTQITPAECISLVHSAGGVISFAHPTWVTDLETLLPSLVEAGLDGIETYYGLYKPETVAWLEKLARRYNLVPTGGTDFHGRDGLLHADLGSRSVPPECLAELERRAHIL
ncbi:MAG TPA: PHP domain-containing protein [Chloroflexia bacterium]|nr:PHP domain-containing protein [Chloroflexia bacterium]